MTSTQIALVDEHRLFRSGIALLISNNIPNFDVLFEVNNGDELQAKLKGKAKPGVVLLDIHAPDVDGSSIIKWLMQHHPEINIMVLSMIRESEKIIALLKLGVKGYVLKDAEPAEFERALQKVTAGELYLPDFVIRALVDNCCPGANQKTINRRELDFLKLAATELTYKEIATKMCISERTVDGYRDALFEKLNIRSRIGLALYAINNKLVN
jgi:DNA-binding NarL/FixJ family response regulator